MRACVIFNPVAKGNKARRFRRHLDGIARDSALKQTSAPGTASTLAAEAVREGFETIVAAGGDGTLHEVLNGIVNEPGGLERVRLGVLPLGTVNVFARELGIPLDLTQAWAAIRAGREARVDLPRVEFANGLTRETRYFAQLAGAGLDARAIELVDWGVKKKVGPLAYVLAGMKALNQPAVRISVTAGNVSLSGALVLIGNGQLYGGEFKLFPKASLRNGLLDVCVFPKASWATLARCGPALLLTRRLPESTVRRVQAVSLTLSSPEPASFELDGELVGRLPATFSIQPGKLRVIVP